MKSLARVSEFAQLRPLVCNMIAQACEDVEDHRKNNLSRLDAFLFLIGRDIPAYYTAPLGWPDTIGIMLAINPDLRRKVKRIYRIL